VALTTVKLLGIDAKTGSLLWEIPISDLATEAVFDIELPLVYSVTNRGKLVAYDINTLSGEDPLPASDVPLEPIWEVPLSSVGTPTLLPLPSGGVVIHAGDQLLGVSTRGEALWDHDPFARLKDWALVNGQLILTTSGGNDPVWTIDEGGPRAWGGPRSGQLATAQERAWIYADDGVYLISLDQQSTEWVYPLPIGMPRLGDIIALDNGNILVNHTDIADRRLLLIGPDGELRWERSYSGLFQGSLSFVKLGGGAYLVVQNKTNLTQVSSITTWRELVIYSVDLSTGELTPVFRGGTRNPSRHQASILPLGDDRLLINLWGETLLMLDPHVALETTTR
jgi:outer membrane protein assembly factor BamB